MASVFDGGTPALFLFVGQSLEMAISQHRSDDREKGRFPGCDEVPTIRNRLADVFFISGRKLGSLKLLVTLPETSSGSDDRLFL